jgi:hypothetical protein
MCLRLVYIKSIFSQKVKINAHKMNNWKYKKIFFSVFDTRCVVIEVWKSRL